jgi:hypothetical protein
MFGTRDANLWVTGMRQLTQAESQTGLNKGAHGSDNIVRHDVWACHYCEIEQENMAKRIASFWDMLVINHHYHNKESSTNCTARLPNYSGDQRNIAVFTEACHWTSSHCIAFHATFSPCKRSLFDYPVDMVGEAALMFSLPKSVLCFLATIYQCTVLYGKLWCCHLQTCTITMHGTMGPRAIIITHHATNISKWSWQPATCFTQIPIISVCSQFEFWWNAKCCEVDLNDCALQATGALHRM